MAASSPNPFDTPRPPGASRPEMDVPKPLHIIKRPSSQWGQKTYPERRGSFESAESDASVGSIPEPPGGDKPLTVAKRRGGARNAGSQLTPRPRRSTSCTDPRQAEDQAGPPPRPPPLSNKASLLFLRRKEGADGVVLDRDGLGGQRGVPALGLSSPPGTQGRRQGGSWLRSSRSMHHLATAPRELDGRMRSPYTAVESDTLSDSGPEDTCHPDPFILVPRIVVTPESKVLEDGVATLWAAVQLSTRICRANNGVEHTRQNEDCSWSSTSSYYSDHGSSQSGTCESYLEEMLHSHI